MYFIFLIYKLIFSFLFKIFNQFCIIKSIIFKIFIFIYNTFLNKRNKKEKKFNIKVIYFNANHYLKLN